MNDQLLLSYYGDDFTGSTDALEALSLAGLRAVLFLEAPSPEALEDFPGVQAIGIAGTGRALTPVEMDQVLPPLFAQLKSLRAPITHYKTCSTFDSSPEIGSIGRAAELGQEVFQPPFMPLLVGVPRLGRYCVFGNLFARAGHESEIFRLDRHPTMSRHPVTPMNESDLRLHLAKQTEKRIELFDILQYQNVPERISARLEELLEKGLDIVLFDVLEDRQLPSIGRLIWEQASQEAPLFALGSSGVEYALTAHWRASGLLDDEPSLPPLEPAAQALVISGSCSPVTERQISRAANNGYTVISLETADFVHPQRSKEAQDKAIDKALGPLSAGKSVILHSCLGPQDPRIEATIRRFGTLGFSPQEVKLKSGKLLGTPLGRMLRALLEACGIRRLVIAGGDTSGYIAAELGIEALEMAAPLAPGAPLCRAYAPNGALHGLEVSFKGGQTGKEDFFLEALHGNRQKEKG